MPRNPSSNCRTCGNHVFYKRTELRARKFDLYCREHLPAKPKPWPDCPECGDDDFPRFAWKGSAEKTTLRCMKCGFEDLATNHFDAVDITVIVSPLEGD